MNRTGSRFSACPPTSRIGVRWLFALAAVLALATSSRPLEAADPDVMTMTDVVVGFNGYWKVGHWAPFRVRVNAPQPTRAAIVVTCPDADDNLTDNPSERIEVPAGASWIQGSFKSGRVEASFDVKVVDGDGRELARSRYRNGASNDSVAWIVQPGLRMDAMLWIGLGKPPGLDLLLTPAHAGERPITAVPLETEFLPRQAHALAALDGVILAATPQGLAEIDPRQNLALRDWVRTGGHLMAAVGGKSLSQVVGNYAPAFVRPANRQKPLPVAEWFPISATGHVEIRQLSGLESFVGQAAPLRFAGALDAPRLPDVTGDVLARGTFGPLLVRAPFGFGQVSFLGVDLNQPPLATWPALPRLYRRVLASHTLPGQKRAETGSVQLTRGSLSDLASQLHKAQDHFPAVQRISYWQGMGLLLLAVLIVGPLDYLLVTRLLRRPAWTWVTLPLFIAVGAAALMALGAETNGRQVLLNELDLIDVDAGSMTLRGRSWLTIYSPASQRFNVLAESLPSYAPPGARPRPAVGPTGPKAEPIVKETMLSWAALPEESQGGVYRMSGASLTQRKYEYDGTTAMLRGLPISQWSTKALVAEWSQMADVSIDNRLERTGLGRLAGSITHRLPGVLEQCLLVHGGHVYVPPGTAGRLAPGQTWRPINARGLKSVLTNARTVSVYQKDNKAQIITEGDDYDPNSRDRDALVRMISFHEGAEGTRFTGLENVALGRLEMTPLLEMNRAVLIGRLKVAPIKWTINDRVTEATERHVFVRLLLPLSSSKTDEVTDKPFIKGE